VAEGVKAFSEVSGGGNLEEYLKDTLDKLKGSPTVATSHSVNSSPMYALHIVGKYLPS
jgi:hypothetical protein